MTKNNKDESKLDFDNLNSQEIAAQNLDGLNEEEIDFETALEELEKIVEDLEQGGQSLDKTVEEFSQGMKLLKFCHKKLNKAEKKIEIMLKEDDEFTEEVPFDEQEKVED
jgi:exodeoxyribonuclease VII small subunit